MKPTRWSLLAALAVLAVAVGWSAVQIWDQLFNRTLPVPVMAVATLTLLALGLTFWAIGLRNRLRQGIADPFVSARSAALAMAASRTGALVGGFYLGTLLAFATDLSMPLASERAIMSALAAVASAGVVVAAMWLERICRIPDDDDEDGSGSRGSGASDAETGAPRGATRAAGSAVPEFARSPQTGLSPGRLTHVPRSEETP